MANTNNTSGKVALEWAKQQAKNNKTKNNIAGKATPDWLKQTLTDDKGNKNKKGYEGELKDVNNKTNAPQGTTNISGTPLETVSGSGGKKGGKKNGLTSLSTYKVVTPELQQNTVAPAPELPQYEGIKYSDEYGKNVDTSFYSNAVDKYKNYAEGLRATQLGEAEKTQRSALKNAYVTRLQNERKTQEALARAGIRGGATETAQLNLANQYGQARAAANTDYTNSINSINNAINQNIFDYQSDMDSRAEEYRQNMAQAQWQAAREDYNNQYQAENTKAWNIWNAQNEANAANVAAANDVAIATANAKTERNASKLNIAREDYTNDVGKWTNFYSKSSKDTLRSKMKDFRSQIKKLKKGKVTKADKKKIRELEAKWEGAAAALHNK